MRKYIDPFDEAIVYSEYDTVALGIQHEGAREIGIRGLSNNNQVFDAYREPSRLLPILLDVPCFIRILDVPVYDMLVDQIVLQYGDPRNTSLPPLMVMGDRKLHEHPSIISVNQKTAIYCWNLYRGYRCKARLLAKEAAQ